MPSVVFHDHQGKSLPYALALKNQGWTIRNLGEAADVLLMDLDVDRADVRGVMNVYRNARSAVVLYPHGANPITVWDGILKPFPVDAVLVPGEGHKDVMEAYGYPNPIVVAGWPYCKQQPFRPRERPARVLFAPIHPLGNGYLNDRDKQKNKEAFHRVLELPFAERVICRLIGSTEENGLWNEPRVQFDHVDMGSALAENLAATIKTIDESDLVVTAAPSTFLHLAVARGCPAVAYGQTEPTSDPEGPGEPLTPVKSWEKYERLMRYPHDLVSPSAVDAASVSEAAEWRRLFVGDDLNAVMLDEALRSLIQPPGPTYAVSHPYQSVERLS